MIICVIKNIFTYKIITDIYIFPENYIEIIQKAITLHAHIYNEFITSVTTVDSDMSYQSTMCENINSIYELNNNLRFTERYGIKDYQRREDQCILYNTIEDKAKIYDHGFINMIIDNISSKTLLNREVRMDLIDRNCFTMNIENNERRITREYFNNSIESTFNYTQLDSEAIGNLYNQKQKPVKNYIHSYNYIPKYIKHFMPDESKDTTLLLGVEIEVGGNDSADKQDLNLVVQKCIQIMNGSDSDDENFIYSTHDSTVQIELDTMPCSLEFHKNKMNYREMFKYLDGHGYKGHDCNTAGLHIHANRSYLGRSRMSQELVISKILYILEKFNDEICVIARRNNEYSEFVGDKKEENSLIELYEKYKNRGKRAALNLQHKDTIEFRMFRSTLKYETFILTLEFVKDIIDFAKSASIEEIEMIKWADLMRLFSPALRNYYMERYNKQYKKIMNKDESRLKRQISNVKKSYLKL